MSKPQPNKTQSPSQVAWRVPQWCDDTGVGRSKAWEMIRAGEIESIKIGAIRAIVTSPTEFINRYRSAAA
jgi:hypothetical protein